MLWNGSGSRSTEKNTPPRNVSGVITNVGTMFTCSNFSAQIDTSRPAVTKKLATSTRNASAHSGCATSNVVNTDATIHIAEPTSAPRTIAGPTTAISTPT